MKTDIDILDNIDWSLLAEQRSALIAALMINEPIRPDLLEGTLNLLDHLWDIAIDQGRFEPEDNVTSTPEGAQ